MQDIHEAENENESGSEGEAAGVEVGLARALALLWRVAVRRDVLAPSGTTMAGSTLYHALLRQRKLRTVRPFHIESTPAHHL